MIVRAPGKINLTLEILARRDDGYHALRSVMVPVGLYDELELAPAARFAFACQPPSLAPDNLVTRALARIELADAPFALRLRKRVPVGAGLGGGSSDAAAVLRVAMDGAFGPVPARDWLADARALGSDVPFFLVDGPALVEGTGERVTALGRPPPWWVVLLVPGVHVATGPAYAALAAAPGRRARAEPAAQRLGHAALRRSAAAWRLRGGAGHDEQRLRTARAGGVPAGRRRAARADGGRRARPGDALGLGRRLLRAHARRSRGARVRDPAGAPGRRGACTSSRSRRGASWTGPPA